MKTFWCVMYGWYVSLGDWMVKQVDTNDYLAGFLWGCIFSMVYYIYFMSV